MANEIAIFDVNDIARMGACFARSGFYGIKSTEEASALLFLAQANGEHPAKAMQEYHVVKGKPSMKAEAMLAKFQAMGGCTKWLKNTDTECTLHLSHPQGGDMDVTWNIERAKNAELLGNPTWKKFPSAMLRARCISEGIRAVYPAAILGFYTPEEVEAIEDEKRTSDKLKDNGEVVIDTERAQTSESKPMDENWKDGVIQLAKLDERKYRAQMALNGWRKIEDVPADRRQSFFEQLNNAINAPKNAPEATEGEPVNVQESLF